MTKEYIILKNMGNEKEITFHNHFCPDVHKTAELKKISYREALANNFFPCPKCCGIEKEMEEYLKTNEHSDTEFLCKCDTVYIRTQYGFWKIYQKPDRDWFYIKHCNVKPRSTIPTYVLVRKEFHQQRDISHFKTFNAAVNYIIKHDNAQKIIRTDYRQLPENNKKLKHYKKTAKNRARKKSIRNVYRLFDELEKQKEKTT